ncbi:MAG: ABC transporter substrate-binding protein [Gemmatimonadales bacterium]|nr:ABC transporter substrate-binding protein [Gemmatimonadales bacterium]NIN10103.1 ABC transporter substrate-binding protein [Gemmatimonadales bacterium]NIR02587.1 ABC transporter substrate-binding protein [Gemmatimonadales bacterium]NIS66281.1 ABC transporter substrate-binding protein [Gemmatimonadales bacterium]
MASRFLISLACVSALSLGACISRDEPILIGLAGPFSQPRGASMQHAAELAVTEINQRGGVRGRPFVLVIRDDSAAADVAVGVARDLYDTPGLVAVIGHLSSGASIAAAPIYNSGPDPVVTISPSASSPQLSGAGSYTFRVCPDDLVHGRRLAEWAWTQLGARSAAVIFENDEYGRGVRSAFSQSFTAFGGSVASEDPYVPAIPSFEPYLQRLARRGGVDALVIAGTTGGAERIVDTADSLGLGYRVLGSDGVAGLEAAPVNADGVFIAAAYLPDRRGSRNEAFLTAYQQVHGDELPDHRGAGAYDIVHLLAQAIEAVGTNRSEIRDYLAGVGTSTPAFEGVTGTIAFDENGDVPNKDVIIGVVRNRRLVTAAGQ